MISPSPNITLDVDLTNPGQFLASCGLLELASRLDPGTVAWFDESRFYVATGGIELLDQFLGCELVPLRCLGDEEEDNDAKSPPVRLGAPFGLVLDWWEDPAATRAGFKTWAGGQTVIGFIDGMREHLRQDSDLDADFFGPRPLKKPKPFYFDSRISRLTALDLGFSAEHFASSFSPAVELLALIGLQRFRPGTVVEREQYRFATWKEPLPAPVAAAVAHGLIDTLEGSRFQFPLVVRTGGKYKAFGPATLERRLHV